MQVITYIQYILYMYFLYVDCFFNLINPEKNVALL